MQALDLPINPSLDHRRPDPSGGSHHFSPIHSPNLQNDTNNVAAGDNNGGSAVVRRERPSRACTQRAAARLQAAAAAEAAEVEVGRKRKKAKRRDGLSARQLKEDSDEEEFFPVEEDDEDGGGDEEEEQNGEENGLQFSRTITPLLGEPEDSQLPRWNIRSMWQLASILDFLNVFRPLLNVKVEFSAEEFETALITPNNTLADIHMPLLKAIPPVTRMALGRATWITVLCRKLRDWWHWVAEGDLPIVASHGTEVEAYNALDPGVRVIILKALCDIRVEQEDIRTYIDDSIKGGVQLSAFRKERLGGDSYGISYWYEDDPIIGHRLYREIRNVEVKKGKGRNIPPIPHSSYQWEAVATNFDEFQNVSEKLFTSKNRTEVSVGKKLKNFMLPEIEKVHKRKEKLLKKQHRQALMLDNMMNIDGLPAGRSRRDRKPVTYTFDDFDRSINEAIKITKKKQPSQEPFDRNDPSVKLEDSTNNGRSSGPSQYSQHLSFSPLSPESFEDEDFYNDQKAETLDRSNRQRQRPQRYSVREFVEAVSDNDADFDSDDDIVGEVVYDEEYLRKRKEKRKLSSSSEGDEEYHWEEENQEEEEEVEEDDVLSTSDGNNSDYNNSDPEPRRLKALPRRNRRETRKSRKMDELQSGLRRSKRSTKNRIDYRMYEMSESDVEPMKNEKSNNAALDEPGNSMGSQDSYEKVNDQPIEEEQQHLEMVDEKEIDPTVEIDRMDNREEVGGVKKRQFLDLNELAPNSTRDEDEDENDF